MRDADMYEPGAERAENEAHRRYSVSHEYCMKMVNEWLIMMVL